MNEKKGKLKLEDIKVESFVTTFDGKSSIQGKGGITGDGCKTVIRTWCNPTCEGTCQTCYTSPLANCCVDV
jgi:hypothetical protein